MDKIENVVVLIPSLDPDIKLINVIKNLKSEGFDKIVCVNDGSESDEIFVRVAKEYQCDIFTHCVNLGKGRALKDGLNYIYNKYPECLGVVTVDGDGQHSAKDTISVAKAVVDNDNSLVMGCRDFTKEDVPKRSKFGNVTTSRVLRLLCGIKLSDTQTGLRGISKKLIPLLVKIDGERFEYELNMILECKDAGVSLLEVPIETIYLEENASSHFNPLLDSIRIYAVFFKFMIVSLSSSVVDLALFSLFVYICKSALPRFGGYIAFSTVLARIISAIYNYTLNKKGVFKNTDGIAKSSVRYAILAVILCAMSAISVNLIHNLFPANETVIKFFVDAVLFLVSFYVQRSWVFKK